jgi:pyridoxamine 5'-phosphate oxidase
MNEHRRKGRDALVLLRIVRNAGPPPRFASDPRLACSIVRDELLALDPSETFDTAGADPDPFDRFERWWAHARTALPGDDADAMVVATASAGGEPSSRFVILRGFDRRGFVFFTNYESAKARDLEENPRAAVLLHWAPSHRQVRASGRASRLSPEESEKYFRSRPRGHRLAAWASPQGQVISGREVLERRFEEAAARFGDDPPLPSFWGGYLVRPDQFEFWQGRENRLHDRVRYRRRADLWVIERLAP